MPLAVVALGGHALLPKGSEPSIEAQFEHATAAMSHVAELVQDGWRVVLTHGNGPQVGHILIRSEAAGSDAYVIPLSVAVAESEGEIGYIVQQTLYNELARRDVTKPVATILTQVLVDQDDPAFAHPAKPVGPFLSEDKGVELQASGATVERFGDAGWRRIVASPDPLSIIEARLVRKLADEDAVVIAAGGGGIPVVERDGLLRGVDAVVDKDLASATLAVGADADLLLILTDVHEVSLDYESTAQRPIQHMTPDEADAYASHGHFPPGTMGPKVEGACRFVRGTGNPALITSTEVLREALQGHAGTTISTQGSPT